MIIKTQIHTIIMLIGPSGSGKSTFAKNVLIPQLSKPMDTEKNFTPNIQYISSDEIRQDILGYNFDKMDEIMTESSTQAFDVLFTKLDAVTTYPINAEFVILDTTGLSEQFRNDVIEIARKNNYNLDAIVFDYKKVEEYKKNFKADSLKGKEVSGKLIAKHMKRLKTETFKTLRKGTYKNVFKIKSKDFMIENFNDYDNDFQMDRNPEYEVFAWDYEKYINRILPTKYDWVTIGDVHGCYDEMQTLIKKYGFEIDEITDEIVDTENTKNIGLIFAGDLVDKSDEKDIEKTIRFIHKNMGLMGNRLQLILGNHEEMVWKWITGDPSLEITPKRIEQKAKYYNTSILLENNEELKEMFLDIFKSMKGWVKHIGTNKRSFIVTHAPCEVKYLEKMDGKSLKWQYKSASRSKNPDMTNDELTPFLKEEAINNQPVHIFGHMGQSNVRTFKNKVCIDAGCVYGGKLIGYSVNYGKPFIQSVSKINHQVTAENTYGSELFAEVSKAKNNVKIEELSDKNQKRLNYIVENGIGYIGGTISPTDKDEETGKLESLKAGLDYYKGKVDEVVLQPKYMGSRAQMYINKNIEKCYATSRNGYKIKQDLSDVFTKELNKYEGFMLENNLQEIQLDGELMPWAAIGEGLIDSQFRVMDHAIKSEIDFLRENGFDGAFSELIFKCDESDFDKVKSTMPKKDLVEKFGHDYHNFKCVKTERERWQPISEHEKYWKIFHEQVEIYGVGGEIHYKPFRLLKAIDTNGKEIKFDMNNEIQFKTFNDDEIMVFKFETDNYNKAQEWYDKITKDEKMEGCVIKPNDKKLEPWITPFMKVRNPNYLTIIYGYDMYFPKKFEKLFNQKYINKKVKASITEYKLGEQMLKTDIKSDDFKQIVANMMFENEKEKGIDPRL